MALINSVQAADCFILRRAFWYGWVRADDVYKALNISRATAHRRMEHALSKYGCLERVRRKIRPRLHSDPPTGARPEDFFRLLAQRQTSFADLGLKGDEISVFYASLRQEAPPTPVINADFIRALVKTEPLDIRYVGLKIGAHAQWRSVLPVAVELFQGQWRVNAHDLSSEGKLKSFVLNRILETRASRAEVPKKLIIQQGILPKYRYQIRFNPRLTADQRQSLRWEMRADEHMHVLLSDIELFEFERQYVKSELTVEAGIVWPLVESITRING